jgi:hypothetical protein
MKTLLLALFSSLTLAHSVLAHGDIEIGPKGGRLVEFSNHQGVHAEVVLKEGQFFISLYDEKAKKEIPVTDQQIIITHRESKEKLKPELKDGQWVVTKPEGDSFWLIIQLKENAEAKAKNGRLHYNASHCAPCGQPEWLCKCG